MTYYSKNKYKFLGFRKSDKKDKMYYAVLENKDNYNTVRVHFGHNKYQNFRDITGLNAYPFLIHGDLERRKRYRARHKGYLKDGYYSPSFFSYYYLW